MQIAETSEQNNAFLLMNTLFDIKSHYMRHQLYAAILD